MTYTFSLFDTGNLVAAFAEPAPAYAMLNRLARESPETAERLLLVAFDADGNAVDDCLPGGILAAIPLDT
jgi:hypothetical protein